MSQLDQKAPEVLEEKVEEGGFKNRPKRKWPYILFFIAASLALFYFFVSFAQIRLDGKAVAVKEVEVQAAEDGLLKEVHVKNGGKVTKGDLLFQFQNRELDFALLRTEEKRKGLAERRNHSKEVLDHTAKMVERAKILFENGVVSKLELEETALENSKSQSTLNELDAEDKALELEADSLKEKKESLSIKASFGGVFIGDVKVRRDTYFKRGETLGLLFDPAQFYLEALLPETKVLNLKVGDQARIAFKGLRGIYDAPVVQVDEHVEEEIEKVFKTKHVLRVLFLLDRFPEGLKPGMRGTARILPQLSAKLRGALDE